VKRQLGEVLFEFRQVGGYLKVSAIDPVTNTEVSIVATPGMDRGALKSMALRKLAFVIEKDSAK
jgi:hypothetical protein